ncbi:MAG: acylneuraminate cytidylyltransferase family protein [Kiloniellales bacterium]
MKRLCTICARGGSKGVPGKNLRAVGGVPLIAHSIRQARSSGLFELVAVSSDSDAILEAASAAGADQAVRRPNELAGDSAAKVPAIRHCVAAVEESLGTRFEILVDLDATAPLRLPEDIVGAVALLENSGADNVITGAPARRSPYFNLVELQDDGTVRLAKPPQRPILRRQDAPRCFDMNASIYVWQRDLFMESPAVFYRRTVLYEMPEERSIDIDSELDFETVSWLMTRRAKT